MVSDFHPTHVLIQRVPVDHIHEAFFVLAYDAIMAAVRQAGGAR